MTIRKVNIAEKMSAFDQPWSPKVLGDINDFQIKAVKLDGEFVWHKHDVEDEMFLIVKGAMRMKFRDHDELVSTGEFIIVPHGIEHCPVAETPMTEVLLFEPGTVLNTGDAPKSEFTVRTLERL